MTEHRYAQRLTGDNEIVFGIVEDNGRNQSFEFLTSVDFKHAARFKRWFERMRDGHPLRSPNPLRFLEFDTKSGAKVFELKSGIWRLYLVNWQGVWFATHGKRKVTDSRVQQEINFAFDRFYRRILLEMEG